MPPEPLPPRRQIRPPGLRWTLSRPASRWPFAWVDVAWAVFSVANLAAILAFKEWETVPFHLIWISLTLLYGFRVWSIRPTALVLTAVVAITAAAMGWNVSKSPDSVVELSEVPLMAVMFWLMVWYAQRRLAADQERDQANRENARLLALQRRFLQDASHQLRTPITIALGHAELLARELSGRPEGRDIQVVVGELDRLRRLGERLLMIAASEDPDFLRAEPVALDHFLLEVLRRWAPTARRAWQLGHVDSALVSGDRERLGLALDALLENAVRHTSDGDMIQLSLLKDSETHTARIVVADSGEGIAPAELDRIFERFRSGSMVGATRGTGLGLSLVRAVAQAHGGEVLVHSTLGDGSQFELLLPVLSVSARHGDDWDADPMTAGQDGTMPDDGNEVSAGPGTPAVTALRTDTPPHRRATNPARGHPGWPTLEDPWAGTTNR